MSIPLDISVYLSNQKSIGSTALRRRLIKEGLKPPHCEECKMDTWRGKALKLELHHVNGDHSDNQLINLRILCPNCHSQAEVHSGKDRKSYEFTDDQLLQALATNYSIRAALKSLGCRSKNVAYWSRAYELLSQNPSVSLLKRSSAPSAEARVFITWPTDAYLAEQIWKVTRKELAKEIGCPENVLRAHLGRNRIKGPPIGYWHRIGKGESHEQAMVPYSDRTQPKGRFRKATDQQVRDAHTRVLNGEGLTKVARSIGIRHSTLIARFRYLNLGQEEGIPTPSPSVTSPCAE